MFWDDARHPIEHLTFVQLLEWHADLEAQAAQTLRRRAAVIDPADRGSIAAKESLLRMAQKSESVAARWRARAEREK